MRSEQRGQGRLGGQGGLGRSVYNSSTDCYSIALDMFLGDILRETSHDLLQFQGGMDQLIQRLVSSIRAKIKCNQRIVGMHVRQDYVELDDLENGQLHTRRW